jgi:arsenate reductase
MSATEPREAESTPVVSQGVAERIARSSQALADPTRVRILSLILTSLGGRAYVSQLAQRLGFAQPTITHHLRKLTDEGILERNFVGRQAWYSVVPNRLAEVVEVLGAEVFELETEAVVASDAVLARISRDMTERFRGVFSAETVSRYVWESHGLLADTAHITRQLPSLTARFTAERLTALAKVERANAEQPRATSGDNLENRGVVPEVLFVCVKNAGRSQMAAAILTSLVGDAVRVRSAGSQPAGFVHPLVVAALDEIGVAVGGEFPKPLTDEVVRAADFVITMGCGDACPVYPGRRYLDWQLPDPLDLPLSGVRAVRDAVELNVRELVNDLRLGFGPGFGLGFGLAKA